MGPIQRLIIVIGVAIASGFFAGIAFGSLAKLLMVLQP